jgi:hypothetical protein
MHILGRKGVRPPMRWQSAAIFSGQPLVCVAIGPDPASNELRGHARGILALGDIATGVVALGGVARGLVAIGGIAVGAVALGGLGVGVLSFAGLALGWLAYGGLAVGYIAVGGLAVGFYALGGAAFGKFVVSGMHRDPQAVEFFSKFLHGILLPHALRPPHN